MAHNRIDGPDAARARSQQPPGPSYYYCFADEKKERNTNPSIQRFLVRWKRQGQDALGRDDVRSAGGVLPRHPVIDLVTGKAIGHRR
uniref:Uncharacterized protein n=1 Tax=Oryza sativa subsp. japonica TaxID=39947 RepID=Q75H22_ORYSJ|nr:hypothetical protein [Oryza sativa Japonica Group]